MWSRIDRLLRSRKPGYDYWSPYGPRRSRQRSNPQNACLRLESVHSQEGHATGNSGTDQATKPFFVLLVERVMARAMCEVTNECSRQDKLPTRMCVTYIIASCANKSW